jgi:hypothetical protein
MTEYPDPDTASDEFLHCNDVHVLLDRSHIQQSRNGWLFSKETPPKINSLSSRIILQYWVRELSLKVVCWSDVHFFWLRLQPLS